MSKFKPKLKALLSTAEAAILKAGETHAESAFISTGQGNYKPQGSQSFSSGWPQK